MANWGPAEDAQYLHVLRAESGKHFLRQSVKNIKGIIQQMNRTLPINTVYFHQPCVYVTQLYLFTALGYGFVTRMCVCVYGCVSVCT